MSFVPDRIAWIDVETSGLDPRSDLLLEVACVITDGQFQVLDTFHSLVRHGWLTVANANEAADPEVVAMHDATGLWSKLRCGFGLPVAVVDRDLAALLGEYPVEGGIWLGGNSTHFDRGFIEAYLPRSAALLSRRCLDMTSVLAFLELSHLDDVPEKGPRPHSAMGDIEECLREARDAMWNLDAAVRFQ